MTEPGARDHVQLVYGCSLVNASAAWQVLLDRAANIAKEHGVKPEDLILGQFAAFMYLSQLT